MSQAQDFEQVWLAKFATCIRKAAGEQIQQQVMQGSKRLSSQSNRQEVIAWSQKAMDRLESTVGTEQAASIMTGCACQYPRAGLQEAKMAYQATRDIDLVHRMLQEQFESFLRETLQLNDEVIDEIVRRGWGLAGIKQGDTIIATKIPKSGYLVEYMQETDPAIRRQYYCHCPRIREVLKSSDTLSATYCYCGAGYYKGIWEEILQRPVQVTVLESVLGGGEVCMIAIQLS